MRQLSFLLTILAGWVPAATGARNDISAAALPGYRKLADIVMVAGIPSRTFRIVALARIDEDAQMKTDRGAPVRPLIVFEKRGGRLVQLARNDHVVMRADEGGQCDPFLDGNATIAVKGRFFTIENGVACGSHWTDFITFRLDDRSGFVFDNERVESWSLNPSQMPDAPAMVRDGPPQIRRAPAGKVIPFFAWRPKQ